MRVRVRVRTGLWVRVRVRLLSADEKGGDARKLMGAVEEAVGSRAGNSPPTPRPCSVLCLPSLQSAVRSYVRAYVVCLHECGSTRMWVSG